MHLGDGYAGAHGSLDRLSRSHTRRGEYSRCGAAGQVGDLGVRRIQAGAKEFEEQRANSLRGRLSEDLFQVFDVQTYTAVEHLESKRQIVASNVAANWVRPERELTQVVELVAIILQGDQHVEQGISIRRPAFGELAGKEFERIQLMRESLCRDRLHRGHKGLERYIAVDSVAQDDQVDVAPDLIAKFSVRPADHGRADPDVFVVGNAAQKEQNERKERVEQSAAACNRQIAQANDLLVRQLDRLDSGTTAEAGGPVVIIGKPEGGRLAAQLA